MFWKLSFRQPCAIDALLDKEDCTLNEILDEDDVLQECKSNNKKLTDFLARSDVLEQLVNLICFEPDEDALDKVKFKYPHLACELLTSEVSTIVEQLSTSNHLLEMLWKFLDTPTPLNPLLASFISKVLAMLLSKEPNVIIGYIESKEDFLSRFMNHLGTSAIMDLLLQMVAAPPTDQARMELAVWLKDEGIVERLVDLIKDQEDESDPEQCVNASNTLCEMIRISREAYQVSTPAPLQEVPNPTPLHEVLESKDTINRLLRNMFYSETPSDVVIINGVSTLLTILRDIMPYMESGIVPLAPDPSPLTEVPPSPGIANVMEMVVPYLRRFHTLLNRKPEIPMKTTIGMLDPPLGNMRLQVVKLISALLSRYSPAVSQEIIQLNMFNSIIGLFFSFPWNNFLHLQVESCVKYVLESSLQLEHDGVKGRGDQTEGEEGKKEDIQSAESSENIKSLKSHLLKDCQFVSKLLDGAAANEDKMSVRRQGYMGHLVRISNSLVKFGDTDEQLKFSLDESTHRRWNNYVNGPLADMNKRNETNLGGNQPLNSNMDDSDDEFDQLGSPAGDSELEKAYQQYLDVKYSGCYLEEYGVEDELSATEEPFEASFTRLMDITRTISVDEEKTNSMFEAVCSDRIQQFDDEEGSEEEEDDDSSTWVDKDANLSSPMEHRSGSSDEDEFISQREFPTGESYDDHTHKMSTKHDHSLMTSPNIITQVTSVTAASSDPDKMEIENSFGIISWKSNISSDEDLSGVISMETGSEESDWTKEPDAGAGGVQSSETGWADFSKFSETIGVNATRSTQSMEDEPSVTPSHITITYITRDLQKASNDDDGDYLEPSERPNSSKYSLLSPEGSQRTDLDPSNIEVAFEGRNSDSDDDDLNSSDSDEDRSGNYTLNSSRGSEGEELLNSLNDSREQEMATSPYSASTSSPSQAPPFTTPTSSSEHDHLPPTTSPNGKPHLLDGDATSSSTRHDMGGGGGSRSGGGGDTTSSSTRHDMVGDGGGGDTTSSSTRHDMVGDGGGRSGGGDGDIDRPLDGEILDGELQDNFRFLSKKGMLSDRSKGGSKEEEEVEDSQSLVEQKRSEALEARANYDKEMQDTVHQSSIET